MIGPHRFAVYLNLCGGGGGGLDIYNNVQVCDISYARNILFNNYAETWHVSVLSKPKLRICREFKTNYGLENYIAFNL